MTHNVSLKCKAVLKFNFKNPRWRTTDISSRIVGLLVYTAIFEKNMRNSTVNYLIPDWLTVVT